MMRGGDDFFQDASDGDDEPLSPDEHPPTTRKKKNKNKRRFTDEQVRSLETIFESETKLEPRKKVQVARELGLQPRQVAIWFQNKRARWKSKQIEKNYRVLKANYDNLKARLDSVRKDKENLVVQLQELRNLLETSHGGRNGCEANSQDIKREEHEETGAGSAARSSSFQEEMDHHQGVVYSDDDKSGNMAYLGQEESELLQMRDNINHGSIISPVKWCSFDAENFFDQSCTSSHWWDSWT